MITYEKSTVYALQFIFCAYGHIHMEKHAKMEKHSKSVTIYEIKI